MIKLKKDEDAEKVISSPPPPPPPSRSGSIFASSPLMTGQGVLQGEDTLSEFEANGVGRTMSAAEYKMNRKTGSSGATPHNTPSHSLFASDFSLDNADGEPKDFAVAVEAKLRQLVISSSPQSAESYEEGETEEIEENEDDEEEEDSVNIDLTKLTELHDFYLTVQHEYFLERRQLELKFADKFGEIFRRRARIIQGTEDESERITNFWFLAMNHSSIIADMISTRDFEALSYLIDIRSFDLEDDESENEDDEEEDEDHSTFGFCLEFHFLPNPYFHNQILTKTYKVPNLYGKNNHILESTRGCSIQWKSDEVNLQKIAGADGTFFNFFDAPWMEVTQNLLPQDLEEEEYETLHEQVALDFKIGHEFYQKLIPEALRWFTGEAAYEEDGNMDESHFEEEEEADEGDGDDDEEEQDDEDQEYLPRNHPNRSRRQHKRSDDQNKKKADCNQQ